MYVSVFKINGNELILSKGTFFVILSEDMTKREFEIITFRGRRKLSKENCLIKDTFLTGKKNYKTVF